jgi:hypothetical protein
MGDITLFHTDTMAWEACLPLPEERAALIAEGQDPPQPAADAADPSGVESVILAPPDRAAHASAVIDCRFLYMFFGWNGAAEMDDVWRFDLGA